MDIVTVDFETYYDDAYSLSKISTESYIRSPLFEVIGVSVKVNGHPGDWYSGENPGGFLRSLDYSNKAILCHHTAFDGAILSWKFGIKPKFWFDTLSMARPIHAATVGGSLKFLAAFYGLGTKGEEVIAAKGKRRADFTPMELNDYGNYCINDGGLTWGLYHKLKSQIPVSELLVIDQIIRMYTEPVIELDRDILQKHLYDVRKRKSDLLQSIGYNTEEDALSVVMSNNKFAQALQALGVEPPRKISLRTGKSTWAFAKTDAGLTQLLEHPKVEVQTLVGARLGTKSTIEETRTHGLLEVSERGTFPIMLNFYGAHTGRLSGGDKLNPHNFPKRTNNTIRRALRAPPGYVLIACDSSQIEARLVAWLAGQDDLLQAFREGRDIYSEFVAMVYGIPLNMVTKILRFIGKTCILGLGYGMGAVRFQETLRIGQGDMSAHIELPAATQIVSLYRQTYFKVEQLWALCNHTLRTMSMKGSGTIRGVLNFDSDGIVLPNGMRQAYNMLAPDEDWNGYKYIATPRDYRKVLKNRVLGKENTDVVWTKIYGGKLTENLIQALAALVIREQMIAIGRRWKVVFQVHDEIVILAHKSQQDVAIREIVAVMSTPPTWAPELPVACEVGAAENYGDV